MKLFMSLVLLCVILSTAYGITCYVGVGASFHPTDCPPFTDRCATLTAAGQVVKSCMLSAGCSLTGVSCCEEDLCNGAKEPDSGTMEPDSGTMEPDSGTMEPDSGTMEPDSGIMEPDSTTDSGAKHVGSSALILLLSSALVSLFL